VLLHGQSLTIERPARATGLAVGAVVSGVALLMALALLMRGLDWPTSFPQFLAYLGAGVMLVVALVFGFWTYACATMQYVVDPAGVSIRWGPVAHRIPASQIQSVARGKGGEAPKVAGVGWPGYHAGRGEAPGHERVLFFSTHRLPEDVVYVSTPTVTYGVSPQDPARFMSAIERARASGEDGGDEAVVERDVLAAHPIWSDRVAQLLLLGAVAVNVALWGFVLAVYPDLSNEIAIEFPPVGDIATLESREEILKIPATATAMLALNLFVAVLFQPRERAATYLVLSGTVFFQVVFWVAAVVAVINA
jgi:hypothetical protein